MQTELRDGEVVCGLHGSARPVGLTVGPVLFSESRSGKVAEE